MNLIKKLIYKAYRFLNWKISAKWDKFRTNAIKLGYKDKNSILMLPSFIVGGNNVFLYEHTTLLGHHTILSYKAKFIMKKYSVASNYLTVVTGNHTSIVGLPQSISIPSHINDKEEDVIVEEDVWIGIGVTLLSGAHVNRGCIIGAKSLITKKSECPPYAVVVGCPSRIIASKFTIEQIVQHEEKLYEPEERLTREYLEEIFKKYFKGKHSLGVNYNFSELEENR